MTALFTLPVKELLTICSCLLLGTLIAAFYYVIIQPKQHEKIIRRKFASKEKIDAIFDENDPFS
ncbi:MAG: hypothetical protein V4507_00660, partial [Verrucomicrobiota bacterium]